VIADTTFIIDLMRKEGGAQQMLRELELTGEQLHLPILVSFELYTGIPLSKQPKKELELIRESMRGLAKLGLTEKIAQRGGTIFGGLVKKGERIGQIDCMIAATALETNETLLTRNAKHFSKVKGLKVETY
jgi:predicted nucleic acid-binding protein